MAKRPLIYCTFPYSTDHAPSVVILPDGRTKDVYPITIGDWKIKGLVTEIESPKGAPPFTYATLEVEVDHIGHPLWPEGLAPPVGVDTRCCQCEDTSGLCSCI